MNLQSLEPNQILSKLMSQLQLEDAPAGGSLVVIHQGEYLAEVSSGLAQPDSSWSADTLSLNYSTGKGVLATLVHVLVSEGVLHYDHAIAQYWPEFAAEGKRDITLRKVLTHQAGLFDVTSLIDDGLEVLAWQDMLNRVANMPIAAPIELSTAAKRKWRLTHSEADLPALTPHYQSVYSALVYGWVIGGLIEAATGLSLAEALKQYLTEPLGIAEACYFGVPKAELHRVAKLPRDFREYEDSHSVSSSTSGCYQDAKPDNRQQNSLKKQDSQATKSFYQNLDLYPCWRDRAKTLEVRLSPSPSTAQISRLYFDPRLMDLTAYKAALNPPTKAAINYHDDEILTACIPAANGVASARALATLYAMLANGGIWQGQQLIDKTTFSELSKIHVSGLDGVMPAVAPASMQWRLGYHRIISACHDSNNAFGHMGYNGSVAWCDPTRQLAFAYVHNHDVTMFTDIRQFILTETVLGLSIF